VNDKVRPPRLTIPANHPRVSADVVKRASAFPSAILADVGARQSALSGRIAPVSPSMKLAGPAFTVEVVPGDNLMIHAAIAMARPGDVLVIDGKGDVTCSLMGEIMTNTCIAMKLGGAVVDAAIRDTEELRELGFPVFAVGANPNGPTKARAGRINGPVSVGGRIVHPGDLIVGDSDGVVVIERERAESILALAEQKVRDETDRIADLRAGKNLVPDWLEKAVRAAGMLDDNQHL
jgi:4-hydroxy-4-methyl-2-oxoglutarate aldolase